MIYRTKEVKARSMLGNQAKYLLLRDVTLVFSAIFVIAIVEGPKIKADPANFTLFQIIFETFSAYGTVGMSMGYRDNPASFSVALEPLSKLILCFMMLMGRHRGLPDSIDHAVQWNKHQIIMQGDSALRKLNGTGSPSMDHHKSTRALMAVGSPLLDHAHAPRKNGKNKNNHNHTQHSKEVSSSSSEATTTTTPPEETSDSVLEIRKRAQRAERRGHSIDMGEFEYVRSYPNPYV
jgi:hypothetical protein